MGSTAEETFKAVQRTLEPYIRPRDEIARIRQILAVHLDSCFKDAAVVGPLALVDTDSPSSSSAARGLQREYLEALNANITARSEFSACCRGQKRSDAGPSTAADQGPDRVQEHLAAIRLRQKHERLQAIEKSLNLLAQKSAASTGFLDPGEIFKDSRALPDVPKALVTAAAHDQTAQGPRLKDLNDQLEIHVLRAKLLLGHEEQLLEKVKSRSTASRESITASAKLEALNRTRAELINWIETELSKASGDGGDADGQDGQKQRAPAASIRMEEQLASIKEKYTQYLEARQSLLQLATLRPKPVIKPPTEEKEPAAPPAPAPPPTAHLLIPYLEQLLSISDEQRGLIAQKSHLHTGIAKQLAENSQTLDHLAEESHLLPTHPMPRLPRPNAGFADAMAAAGGRGPGPSSRAKRWVFAADSAKISTLEAVAEKIEEGQIALEGSMRTLGEMDELLGQFPGGHQDDEGGGADEEDPWLAEGRPAGGTPGTTRRKAADKPTRPRTVWDTLDGNLGLLRSDKHVQ